LGLLWLGQGKIEVSPGNTQGKMIAGTDGAFGLVVEEPIDGFEMSCAFVLGGQGIIKDQKQGDGLVTLARFQVVQESDDQGQTDVVGIPGADAEEVSEITGIDAIEFLGSQFGQRLAAWRDDQEVGEAFQMTRLGDMQTCGQAQESEEGANGQGTLYDGLHRSRVSRTSGL
jgi:hypothetical protein